MNLEYLLTSNSRGYDFKNEAPTETVRNETNPILRYFRFRTNDRDFYYDSCDLAKKLYRILWDLSDMELNLFSYDTMNSFYRLFRRLLVAYDGDYWDNARNQDNSEISGYDDRYNWLLRGDVYTHYIDIYENETVRNFAKLTGLFGNLTLVPKGFNTLRNSILRDYWDITLQYFKIYLGESAFNYFVTKYYYKNYVNGEDIKFYWKDHSINKRELPTSASCEEIIEVMGKINSHIELREDAMRNDFKQRYKLVTR